MKYLLATATIFLNFGANAYTIYDADAWPICRALITLGNSDDPRENSTVYDGPVEFRAKIRVNSGQPGKLKTCAFTNMDYRNCDSPMRLLICNTDLRPQEEQVRQLR